MISHLLSYHRYEMESSLLTSSPLDSCYLQAILPANAQQGLSLYNLALPLLTVFLAIAIGVCGGLLLSIVLKLKAIASAPAGLVEAAGR